MLVTPRDRGWSEAALIFFISVAISFALIGQQVFSANWGIIDDYDIFRFLGARQHLSIADFFNTLLTKTEVGAANPDRFRPSYYFLLLLEAAPPS